MQLSDVLKQIQPCNMDEPYIFISYSAKDADRVWQDVLRFQQLGYNVWLDEKNLDKTQDSWRSDALEAIRDMYCSLLVFYVSRNSLVSQPCFSELSCTIEDITKAIHNGPVKFVAVDVEPINDIVQFSQEVYQEIRRKDIPKAEKTTQAITLSNCIGQFFNSNNEKVRVKPYDMPNRKMDYYEEIAAAFPDDTKVLPVVVPAKSEDTPALPQEAVPVPVPTAEPESVIVSVPAPEPAPEPVPVVESEHAPEPVPVVEPEPKPVPAKKSSPKKAAKKPAPESNDEPEMDEDAQDALLRSLDLTLYSKISDPFNTLRYTAADSANKILWKLNAGKFKKRSDVSSKQKKNFSELFGIRPDEIVGVLDASSFGAGKEGIALTEYNLYSTWNPSVVIPLFQIQAVRDGKEGHLDITYTDGTQVSTFWGICCAGVKDYLNTYSKADLAALEAGRKDKIRRDRAAIIAYWNEFGFGKNHPPKRTKPLPADPVELANFAMSEFNRDVEARDSTHKFEPIARIPEKKLRGALGSYARGVNEKDVLGLMDDSIFGSGKAGFLLTRHALYTSNEKKHPIQLAQVAKIKQGSDASGIVLVFDDHYEREYVFYSDAFAVKMLLQVYIDSKNGL